MLSKSEKVRIVSELQDQLWKIQREEAEGSEEMSVCEKAYQALQDVIDTFS